MADDHNGSTNTSASLTNMVYNSQRLFGILLRELCEISGFTQGKLSRESKSAYKQLIKDKIIRPDDPIGSLEQPTISKVMAGVQDPTYFQVYIWLDVIKKHFQSDEFKKICEEYHIEDPDEVFTDQLEQQMWSLSGFVTPRQRESVYEEIQDISLIKIYDSHIEHKEERFEANSLRHREGKIRSKRTRMKAV